MESRKPGSSSCISTINGTVCWLEGDVANNDDIILSPMAIEAYVGCG